MKREICQGFKSGSLSFVCNSQDRSKDGRLMSEWLCECGNIVKAPTGRVLSGQKDSCGCLGRKRKSDAKTTHGMRRTKEYATWVGIKDRCLNVNGKDYPRYGGAGITICSEWAESFVCFLAHIGRAPSQKHQVDRIDNQRGYEPGNVRWATSKTQSMNRRNSKTWHVKGLVFDSITDAARHFSVSAQTIMRWCYGGKHAKSGKPFNKRSDCYADSKY